MVVETLKEEDRSYPNNGTEERFLFRAALPFPTQMQAVRITDVTITASFYQRHESSVDPYVELAALKHLSRFVAAEADLFLKQLSNVLMEACVAGSAGVTLEERRGPSPGLHWISGAGRLIPKAGEHVPFQSPSRIVVERQRAEVFHRPERFYTSIQHPTVPLEELLVVPWTLADGRRGTIWIASHDPRFHFDPHDLRLVESLAKFATFVLQRHESEQSRRSREALTSAARLADQLAHEINNPLQALMNLLHLVPLSAGDEYLPEAKVQAKRLGRAVQSVLEIQRDVECNADSSRPPR